MHSDWPLELCMDRVCYPPPSLLESQVKCVIWFSSVTEDEMLAVCKAAVPANTKKL